MKDDVIVLHAMRWPDEIRAPAELLPPPVELTEEEIDGALAPPDPTHSYTDALAQVIEAKREGKPLPEAPEPEERGGKVFDSWTA